MLTAPRLRCDSTHTQPRGPGAVADFGKGTIHVEPRPPNFKIGPDDTRLGNAVWFLRDIMNAAAGHQPGRQQRQHHGCDDSDGNTRQH